MSGSIYTGLAGPNTRRAGVLSMEIGGEVVEVAGDFAYDATPFKREMLIGLSGPQGYSEMPKNCAMTATLRDSMNLSVANLFGSTNINITVVLASGKTVYGSAMTCTECSEVKAAEGTFDVKFEGYITESST